MSILYIVPKKTPSLKPKTETMDQEIKRLREENTRLLRENEELKKSLTPPKMGQAGGNARAEKLSANRRSEIARIAAQARWGKMTA